MLKKKSTASTQQKPLRLWPGAVAAALLGVTRFIVPIFAPDAFLFGLIGAMVGTLVIAVWWLFFSRAPWLERVGAIILMIVALAMTPRLLHESIATAGQGMLFFIYAIPILSLAFVAAILLSRRFADGPRRATMATAILLACGAWALLRTDGVTGGSGVQLAWRWSKTPEERLLSQAAQEPAAMASAPEVMKTPDTTRRAEEPAALSSTATTVKASAARRAVKTNHTSDTLSSLPMAATMSAEWPGFRGPGRDGVVRGVQINTDWAASPPVELWRRPIGPAWSSFAIHGNLFYTQEQRGEEEIVSCYNLATGAPVWMHRDSTRFWEANAGPGPRATPTLSNGHVYTFGATGILNALDARDGSVVWSRNAASDTDTKVPYWGFAGSPLVANDIVIAAVAGKLAAYDRASGNPRWFRPDSSGGYSSPHLLTIAGVTQFLLVSGAGIISVAPQEGTLLWEHKWNGDGIVQPALAEDGDVLIGTGSGFGENAAIGVRRLTVTNGSGGWTVKERWTSNGLKPYYNDFVVHKGHAFGFDGSILACIDLADGKRKWKGGRYGNGQLVLLSDQDLLLVVSEHGELALVGATPGMFTELARFPAIKGKTWNHPALAGDLLLVRNGQEMVAFRLPLARS